MTAVIGIDQSLSNTGVALARDHLGTELWTTSIKGEAKKYPHPISRLAAITSKLESILELIEEDLPEPGILCLEGYAFATKNSRAHALGEWGGQIRLLAYRRGWVIAVIPPSTLKKFVTGNGHAPKDTLMMEVLDKWGFKAPDNNVADAFALMKAGCLYARIRAEEDVPKKDSALIRTLEVFEPARFLPAPTPKKARGQKAVKPSPRSSHQRKTRATPPP